MPRILCAQPKLERIPVDLHVSRRNPRSGDDVRKVEKLTSFWNIRPRPAQIKVEMSVANQLELQSVPTAKTDGMLLASVAADGSAESFEKLVERYSAMVLNICQRQLGDIHEAEDATQAVFLVLWSKAASLKRRDSVAGWLHHVARNVCRNAKRSRQVRKAREREMATMNQDTPSKEDPLDDIKEILDEELDQLPRKYRLPIILCHLEGRSQAEVAALLRLKQPAVSKRLKRGYELLRTKLARRGMAAGAASVTSILTACTSSAAVPAGFISSTTQAASLFGAGKLTVAGLLSAKTAALAKGAINMMTIAKFKVAAVVIATTTIVTGGSVIIVQQAAQGESDRTQQTNKSVDASKQLSVSVKASKPVFQEGEPLVFDVTFENVSNKPFRLNEAQWINQWEIKIHPGPWLAMSTIEGTPDYKPIQVEPGKKATFRGVLDESYRYQWKGKEVVDSPFHKQLPPGTYALQPTIKQPDHNDEGAPYWVGEIIPEPAKFTIADPREKSDGKGKAAASKLTSQVLVPANSEDSFRDRPLAISPDGKQFVIANDKSQIGIYPTNGGKVKKWLTGHDGWVTSLDWSPNGKWIASGSNDNLATKADGTFRIWNAETGEQVYQFARADRNGVADVQFSPDSSALLVRHSKGVSLWSFDVGAQLPSFQEISDATFAANGESLIASDTRGICAISIDKQQEMRKLSQVTPGRLAVSPDGKLLATGSHHSKISIWDLQSQERRSKIPWTGFAPVVMTFSPDSRTLGALVMETDNPPSGKPRPLVLHFWDVNSGRLLQTISGAHIRDFQWSPDGRSILTTRDDGSVRRWTGFTAQPQIQKVSTQIKATTANRLAKLASVQRAEFIRQLKSDDAIQSFKAIQRITDVDLLANTLSHSNPKIGGAAMNRLIEIGGPAIDAVKRLQNTKTLNGHASALARNILEKIDQRRTVE